MRRAVAFSVLAVLLAAALPAAAAKRPDEEQKKIDFLLDEVGKSGAIFIRNGAEYPSTKAVSHLKQKLFFAGSRVQTARQFIVGVASHSEETKENYKMRLTDGTTTEVGVWLMEKLSAYETAHGEKPGAAAAPAKAPR